MLANRILGYVVAVFDSLFGPSDQRRRTHGLLIAVTAVASIVGAVVGSWLMTDKLKPGIIKKILGVVLIGVAVKMVISLI